MLRSRSAEPRTGRRASNEAGVDFAVTIAAQEDTFSGLRSVGSQRLSSRHRHLEDLCRRVDVVEVEADDAAVVSAQSTRAAGFVDQRASHCLMSSGHRFRDAALAAPPGSPLAVGVVGELGGAVSGTVSGLHRTQPIRGTGPSCALNRGTVVGQMAVLSHERMFAPWVGQIASEPEWAARDLNPELGA